MKIKLPKYESHRLITPVTSALARGEIVDYQHRDLGRFGRFVNKISPGTFPDVITTATIGDSHRKHHVKPMGDYRGMLIPSIEGVRWAFSNTPLPSENPTPREARYSEEYNEIQRVSEISNPPESEA